MILQAESTVQASVQCHVASSRFLVGSVSPLRSVGTSFGRDLASRKLRFNSVGAALSGSLLNVLSDYPKPKSPTVLLRLQHFPPLQFFQQQHFDFLRPRLQAAGFFVVFEDFGVGKLGVQIGLFGFQRGDFVGQSVEFALFFVRQFGRAVGLGFVFFRRPSPSNTMLCVIASWRTAACTLCAATLPAAPPSNIYSAKSAPDQRSDCCRNCEKWRYTRFRVGAACGYCARHPRWFFIGGRPAN